MTRRFISPAEAGEYLSIKPKTIYSLAARGLLPCVRFGRQLRIDLRRLDELAEAEISQNMNLCGRPRGSGLQTSPAVPGLRGAGRSNGEDYERSTRS